MNGKSIEIDNTDAEGRLILSGTDVARFRVIAVREAYSPVDRRNLLRLDGVQAAHPHRRRDAHGVSHALTYRNYHRSNRPSHSSMDYGLGEVYSGVFTVSSLSFAQSTHGRP